MKFGECLQDLMQLMNSGWLHELLTVTVFEMELLVLRLKGFAVMTENSPIAFVEAVAAGSQKMQTCTSVHHNLGSGTAFAGILSHSIHHSSVCTGSSATWALLWFRCVYDFDHPCIYCAGICYFHC